MEQGGDDEAVKKNSDDKRGGGSPPLPEENKPAGGPGAAAEQGQGNGSGESGKKAESVGASASPTGSAAGNRESQVAGAAGAEGGPEPKTAAEPPSVAELQAALDQALKEKEDLQEQLLRLRADFENFRKRAMKEKADTIQFGNEALLKDLLPVIDNIERVLSSSLKEQDWKGLQEGIRLVLSEMRKTLSQRGLEAIEAVGAPFDPTLHEAIQRVETAEATAATVVEECQKGYLYRGRLLRPSLVVVAVPPEGVEGSERPGEKASEGLGQGSSGEPIVN